MADVTSSYDGLVITKKGYGQYGRWEFTLGEKCYGKVM